MTAANVPPKIPAEVLAEQARQIAAEPQYSRPAPQALIQRIIDTGRVASAAQLALPHQLVTLRNTDPDQEHIFINRYNQGVSFKPGETKEIDLLKHQIDNLIYSSRSDRGFYDQGPNKGKPFPPHPVKIVGFGAKSDVTPAKTI